MSMREHECSVCEGLVHGGNETGCQECDERCCEECVHSTEDGNICNICWDHRPAKKVSETDSKEDITHMVKLLKQLEGMQIPMQHERQDCFIYDDTNLSDDMQTMRIEIEAIITRLQDNKIWQAQEVS